MAKADFPPDEARAQCRLCYIIKIASEKKKKTFLKESLVLMPSVKKITCYSCKQKEK